MEPPYYDRPLDWNLPITTTHWSGTFILRPPIGLGPSYYDHPLDWNLPITTTHWPGTSLFRPLIGLEPPYSDHPLDWNLPIPTTHWTGHKNNLDFEVTILPDLTSFTFFILGNYLGLGKGDHNSAVILLGI